MLKHPRPATRRHRLLLGGAIVACAGLAWAGQSAPAADAAAPGIRLNLMVTQQVGNQIHRRSLVLQGRQGETMRVDKDGNGDGAEAGPPLSLEVAARVLPSGAVRVDAVMREGTPLAVTARPQLVMPMNEPALVEHVAEDDPTRRTRLLVVPNLPPAR